DGHCPLCVAEMRQLARLDTHARLRFEDIKAIDFGVRYPEIDTAAVDAVLHGRFADGTLIFGLDVTRWAWSCVGRKPWLALLRWPLIRPLADRVYRLFARHRYRISGLLTGQRRCDSCPLPAARHER
ncbi:MAG: DUF393 domain-containing protein, partial [Pseudohongiellaceae bacterium]